MARAASFVDVRHVTFAYTHHSPWWRRLMGYTPSTTLVFRDIDFSLNTGAHLTVFGAPGAGKTTLLKLLVGALAPTAGRLIINGHAPAQSRHLAAGYVSAEESEPRTDTVNDILHAFGITHDIQNLPARVGAIAETLQLNTLLALPAQRLSSSQRIRVNLARAALSDAPLILADDLADYLPVKEVQRLCQELFGGRTVLITTRHPACADALGLPLIVLHNHSVRAPATHEQLAYDVACPLAVNVWVEGVNYDLVRRLNSLSGVTSMQLVASPGFAGQRLHITLQSPHYLPAIYDLVSRASLVRVEEEPIGLADIVARLPQ